MIWFNKVEPSKAVEEISRLKGATVGRVLIA